MISKNISQSSSESSSKRVRSTKRSSLSEFPPSVTEQEHAPHMTMASIQKQLEKGIMFKQATSAIYSSDLGLRNLQDVHDRHNEVMELFAQLPTEIKKLAENDFRNFESVLSDTENHKIFKKYDLIVDKDQKTTKLYSMTEDQFKALKNDKDGKSDTLNPKSEKTP